MSHLKFRPSISIDICNIRRIAAVWSLCMLFSTAFCEPLASIQGVSRENYKAALVDGFTSEQLNNGEVRYWRERNSGPTVWTNADGSLRRIEGEHAIYKHSDLVPGLAEQDLLKLGKPDVIKQDEDRQGHLEPKRTYLFRDGELYFGVHMVNDDGSWFMKYFTITSEDP